MAVKELTLSPTAVALHTRDRDDDYGWRVEVGQFSMALDLKKMHRELLADKSAIPATSLLLFVLDQKEPLGLVVANLKSQRRDHTQTPIDDALSAEFGHDQRRSLLLAVASLLDPSTADCRSRFLDYAEDIFNAGAGLATTGTIRVPDYPGDGDDGLSGERHVVLRSNDANLRRVAAFLRSAAVNRDILNHPFLLVSTGFVGPESFENFAQSSEQFIAISRSSKVPNTGVLPIKKKPRRSWTFSSASVVAGVGGICLLSLLIYRGISLINSPQSPNSKTVSPNSNATTSASSQSSPGAHRWIEKSK